MRLLNIGCGTRFHKDWVNIDVKPSSPNIQKCNILEGILFPDETFDVVYHSHVLEHLQKNTAPIFMKDCFRLLKPGGIIRIAVPDTESLLRVYLTALEKSLNGDPIWQQNYEWLKLEVYDQMVREESGGNMALFLKQPHIPNKIFVLQRIGVEGKQIMQENFTKLKNSSTILQNKASFKKYAHKIIEVIHHPKIAREAMISRLLGDEYKLLQLGRFRKSGEIHLWMYDKYSLTKTLNESGFISPKQTGASESRVPNWSSFNLDTEPDGSIYKPDSLYMEAIKP